MSQRPPNQLHGRLHYKYDDHLFMIQSLSSLRKRIRFIRNQTEPYQSEECPLTCMASNLTSRKLVPVGKQFASHVSSRSSASPLLRRTVHVSVYDKNLDDHVRPAQVPDEVIDAQSEKYWSPHPQTGVFGPDTDHQATAAGERGFHSLPASEESVLEQKAFFRPQEDLDKPADT